MSNFKLTIATPDGIIYNETAENVIVRTLMGSVGILKNHAPFAAPLDIGEARIKINGEWKIAACIGGVISTDKDGTYIVANAFEWAEDIDLARAENAKRNAESVINSSGDISQLDKAKGKLLRAITRIEVANNK